MGVAGLLPVVLVPRKQVTQYAAFVVGIREERCMYSRGVESNTLMGVVVVGGEVLWWEETVESDSPEVINPRIELSVLQKRR